MLAANNIATNTPFARFYNVGGMGYVQVGKQRNIQPSAYSWHITATVRYYTSDSEREVVGGKTTDLTYISSPAALLLLLKQLAHSMMRC